MQRLIFGGQQLQDENQVLNYNILEESMVDLQLPALHMHNPLSFWTDAGLPGSIKLFFKTLTGKTLTIPCYFTDTIDIVKFRVQDKEGFAIGEYFKTGPEHNFW